MRTPLALLKFIAKAGLNAVSNGVAGDFAVEVVPDLAVEVWKWWSKGRSPQQLRADVEAVAQLTPLEARQAASVAVADVAADQPPAVQQRLEAYLLQIPATIRQAQRRPADPSGLTVDIHLSLCKPQDLLPLLPVQLSRFAPGDRPSGIGDWELEELLGKGGFGEVWKARNPHLAEPVALKFCLDPVAAQVLRNEAALLGRVMSQGQHPGIVRLRHTYLNADPPCLEYEYVAGGDLAGLLARWEREPPADRVAESTRLIRGLAGIVAFAHRLSPPIVHRDLKPANVLLQLPADEGDSPRLRVADFGIGGLAPGVPSAAGPTTRSPSLLTLLRGAHTPLYASPQQLLGQPPLPRDDVYSLGVIWYQLLTGNRAIAAVPAEWRDELAERGVPAPVARLLGSCLAAQAERRPADAGVLAHELAELLAAGQTRAAAVSAVPPCPGEELAAQVRRTLQHVGFVHAQARQRGEASHDYAGAVALLEEVPEHLRDGALYTKLRRCRDRVAELDSRIRVAVEAMRFADVRAYAEELLRLMPERDDLRRLLEALPADVRLPRRFRNCVGMKLVLIRAGTFLMGSPRSEPQRHGNEGLAREVTVERPFYLGVYPVTQRQYEKVMGRNPSWFCKANRGGSQHPVEQVTWHEAVEFCQRLSEHPDELSAHRVYRLPSEAEWEYACRAGTTTPFSWGASASSTSANFNGHFPYGNGARGPYRRRTTSVGHYEPNSWGLFDLHGNVWEWCSDRYLDGDPVVEEKGRDRVVRGGSWFNEGGLCRSACRLRRSARDGDFNVGFRVAATVSAAPG